MRYGRLQLMALVGAAVAGGWGSPCAAQPTLEPKRAVRGVNTVGGSDGSGWTTFSASVDSRIVYVSTSTGDDANSGFSPALAKKTLLAAYGLMRDGMPDWMLLKRGDVWSESFPDWQKAGRGPAEMMVIGSYGTGNRPLLNTGTGKGFFTDANGAVRAHLALTDIHFRADRPGASATESGVTVLNRWSDVLIENCKVESYASNIVVQEAPFRPANIRVRRCVVVDAHLAQAAHSQGIFAGGIDGLLIEECVFDNNGWKRGVPGAQANIFNHNMYLHETGVGFVTRGNISARGSATGILQRSGGTCENNLLLLNPTGVFLGASQVAGPSARSALRNNVVLDSRDIASDTPRGAGIWLGGTVNTEVYGNIVAHQRSGSGNINAFNFESTLTNLPVHRNIVYDWTGAPGVNGIGLTIDLHHVQAVQIIENRFHQVNGGFLVELRGQPPADSGPMFGRNRYMTTNPPPNQFYWGMTYSQWVQLSDEQWSTYGPTGFPFPERSIETYMASLGMMPTLDAFMDRARLQEKGNWDTRFTATTLNDYIQQGFGVSARGCRADFNDDLQVNALDFTAFQAAFGNQDPRADMNLDGVFDLRDLQIFQSVLAAGCP